jgi:aspartate beta-hydroxylase
LGYLGVQAQQLVYSAQQAMQSGRLDEAARLWAQVLATAPEHPQALFHLGQHKLMQKDVVSALNLLERAAKADPNAPAIPLNIAFAQRTAGNAAAELAALDRALTTDPYFLPALLAKGAALERGGQPRTAAQVFSNALDCAPPDEQLTPELRGALQRARESVERNARELESHLHAALLATLAKYENLDLARFKQCRDIAVGRKKVFTSHPSMLHFPAVPAIQFYDRSEFPWLEQLEAATPVIREEFRAIFLEDNPGFIPYIDRPDNVPLNQWAELNRSPRWSVFFLWKDGRAEQEHIARCPGTAAALEHVPLAHTPNYAPTVNFSLLAPRTRIPPHTGSTNVRLIVHLPLIVPDGCAFRVGNETREWEEGRAWVFDDTIEHEAWNNSDQLRVILMMDVWNPYLTLPERELVSALLNGMTDYYGAC